jgi:hypothetical protein
MSGQMDLTARLALAESVARRAGALARAYFDYRDSLTVVSKRSRCWASSSSRREAMAHA